MIVSFIQERHSHRSYQVRYRSPSSFVVVVLKGNGIHPSLGQTQAVCDFHWFSCIASFVLPVDVRAVNMYVADCPQFLCCRGVWIVSPDPSLLLIRQPFRTQRRCSYALLGASQRSCAVAPPSGSLLWRCRNSTHSEVRMPREMDSSIRASPH